MNIYHVQIYKKNNKKMYRYYFNSIVLAPTKSKAIIKALDNVNHDDYKKINIKINLINNIDENQVIVLPKNKTLVSKDELNNIRVELKKYKDVEYESKVLEHLKPTDDKLVNLKNMLDTLVYAGEIELSNRVRKMIEIEEEKRSKDVSSDNTMSEL